MAKKSSYQGSVSEFKKKDSAELIALVKRYYKNAKQDKRSLLPEWAENISYMSGPEGHWVEWDKAGQRLKPVSRPRGRVHLAVDEITPVVEMANAKLLATRPDCQVLPSTGDEDNRQASQIGQKFLEHCYYELNIEEMNYAWIAWALSCGCCFTKTMYNPDIGHDVIAEERIVEINPDTGQPEELLVPILDENGEPMMRPSGGIEHITVSPYEVFVDPTGMDMSELRYLIHAKNRTIDYITERWPKKGKDVVPSSSEKDDLLDSAVTKVIKDGHSADDESSTALVIECWIKPCSDFPKGKVITVAGDVLLEVSDFPLESGELPFVMISWGKTMPGRFWPVPPISRLIPMQKNINKTYSQIIEHKNSSAFPPLFIQAGTRIAKGQWTNAPGSVVEYKGDKEPTPAYPKPLPNYVVEIIDRMKQSIMDASGFQEIERGAVPTGVNTATGIKLLQERNDLRLGPVIRCFELAYQSMCKLFLQFAGEYYTEKHMIRISGKDNQTIVDEFYGADLKGNYDVIVLPGSTKPRSPAARQQSIIEKMQAGLYGDMGDLNTRRKALEALDEADVDGLFDVEKQAEKQARDEAENLLEQGIALEVQPWHDHAVHLSEHMRAVNFEDMSNEQRQVLWEHIKGHEVVALQLQMEQQQLAQAIQGGYMGVQEEPLPEGYAVSDDLSAVGMPADGGQMIYPEGFEGGVY